MDRFQGVTMCISSKKKGIMLSQEYPQCLFSCRNECLKFNYTREGGHEENSVISNVNNRFLLFLSEKIIVVNNDRRCPEEEQTFILTLVEIPADSKEFDISALLEQTSEPLLPAPILISPMNASEANVTEVDR